MNRRAFIALIGGAAVARPLAARAQQPGMLVIGFLNSETPAGYALMAAAFRNGLNETGFVEGKNVAIEYRWAEGQYDRLPGLATDLVRRQVTVIAANTPLPVKAAMAATSSIPIVFATGFDPVAAGYVASLNRPGGNLTGVTSMTAEVGPKRVELLRELLPTATSFALLVNRADAADAEAISRGLQAAARSLGLQSRMLYASTDGDLDTVFANLAQLRPDGLVISSNAFFNSRSELLAALAIRLALPAIYQYREFAAAGGLMSYGSSLTDMYRQVGVYTGRILKGEKPGDLPVVEATKIELIINLKTAMALGLTFPLSVLGRADEVIE